MDTCRHPEASRYLVVSWSLTAFSILTAHAYASDPSPRSQPRPLATFEVATAGDPLILPVAIDGHVYEFILDFGVSRHVFDTSLRQLLGAPVGHTRSTSQLNAELYRPPVATVGELPLRDGTSVVCLDLAALRRCFGDDIRGILGVPFLYERIVRIDFDDGRLDVLSRTSDARDWGVPLPLKRNGSLGYLRVSPARVASETIAFCLGSSSAESAKLSHRLFERLWKQGDIRLTDPAMGMTVAGTVVKQVGRLSELAIGPFLHRDLIVCKSSDDISMLGLPYLSRYVVTLDLTGEVIYLRKGKNFDKLDQEDMSGLHILKIDGELVVCLVDEGTPPHDGGI